MKIIRRKSDNVVLFKGADLVLDAQGVHSSKWRARNISNTDHELLNVPSIPDGFVGGGWTYDGTTWTPTAQRTTEILSNVKKQKKIELNAAHDALIYSDILHSTKTYTATPERQALLAQILSIGSVPAGMYWRDKDGNSTTMTFADLQAFGSAILSRSLTADIELQHKLLQVDSATTTAEVESISFQG